MANTPYRSTDAIVLLDQWQLRVPEVESLCKTFSLGLDAMRLLCQKGAVPDRFQLFRHSEDRVFAQMNPKELTANELASVFEDEVSRLLRENQ
jgi:hypothetical protein